MKNAIIIFIIMMISTIGYCQFGMVNSNEKEPSKKLETWINVHKKPIKVIKKDCAVGRTSYTFISVDGSIHIYDNGTCWRDLAFPDVIGEEIEKNNDSLTKEQVMNLFLQYRDKFKTKPSEVEFNKWINKSLQEIQSYPQNSKL